MTPKKTNAARYLDELKLAYELVSAPVDENDLSAETMARNLGVPEGQVFKTLVLRGDTTPMLLACIPAGVDLDLKALARVSGNKRVDMVPLKDVLPLTGYMRGGCSPLRTRKPAPVFIDESVHGHERVFVSAGQRGLQLHLAPEALLTATQGVTAPLAAR